MKLAAPIAMTLMLTPTLLYGADAGSWQAEFVKVNKPQDVRAAFPAAAAAKKVGGDVVLDCVAAADGRLVDCKIASEEPAGLGFAEAALKLVQNERIKPTDATGASVAGRPVKSMFSFLGRTIAIRSG